MDENFNTRRRIYGDKVLGEANLEMVEIARCHDSCVKFAGSGGAVFGICVNPQKKLEMKKKFQEKGYVFCDVQIYQPEVDT